MPTNAEMRPTLLSAFINETEAQRGKKLTEEQADQLIALADRILAEL